MIHIFRVRFNEDHCSSLLKLNFQLDALHATQVELTKQLAANMDPLTAFGHAVSVSGKDDGDDGLNDFRKHV